MRSIRPRRFQAGGANDDGTRTTTPSPSDMASRRRTDSTTPAAGGSPQPTGDGTQTTGDGTQTTTTTPAAPSSTTTAPSGSNVDFFSLTPAQQQVYLNGGSAADVAAAGAPAAASAPSGAGANYNYNPYAPPSQNPAAPAGYVSEPFGTGTSVVPSGQTAYQNFLALQNSPFMTPAAIANQSIVGNAGLPGSLQGDATVPVGDQQVAWKSMTPSQQYMYEYLLGTGQSIPSDFMATYQGPSAAWNSPALNTLGVPSGAQVVNGALVNSSGKFAFPGSSAGPGAASATGAAGAAPGRGGIASPGAFTSPAPGGGVGTGMGAAGTPATPQAQPAANFMGQSGGLGYRRGGGVRAEGRAPMRIRPRKFQMGGVNPAGGAGVNPLLLALMQSGQGGGPMPPQMPPGAGPAGMGAMAGALPGGPGAAALGAMAGASHPGLPPGATPGAGSAGMGALAGASPGGPGAAAMGAMAGASPGTPPQSPNQQWGQLLLSGAPGTGLGNQGGITNPAAQQALYRARLSQLGAGGFAKGGQIPHEPGDHPPASHPDRQVGLVADGDKDRYRKGGRARSFDSTKPAPGNLATHGGGKFARGGKAVLRRKPKKASSPPPTPPLERDDLPPSAPPADLGAAGPPSPVAAPAASGPPAGGAPFAKGGEVCEKCGKAHGGECKGMRRGGKFHGAKAKKPKMAEGGKWIQSAIKKPGALHAQLGVPQGEKIPAGKLAKAAKSSGKLGQRARLAQTLKGMNKAEGGSIKLAAGGAAKQRRGYPKTMAPPKKARFANGGKIRGYGAATKGRNFSGIY